MECDAEVLLQCALPDMFHWFRPRCNSADIGPARRGRLERQ